MSDDQFLSISETAKLLGKSKETLRRWKRKGVIKIYKDPLNQNKAYKKNDIYTLLKARSNEVVDQVGSNVISPNHLYHVIDLFAGAGGLALGFEKAGLQSFLLSDKNKWACQTLQQNRPNWNVLQGDIHNYSFLPYKHQVDVITGGFPCQAFSYAGKSLGFQDVKGTLFYEFARVVDEVQPAICIGENVKGLLNHDGGKTINTMCSILGQIGYNIVEVKVLKAIHYGVPQKRERVFLVGIRKDIGISFQYPKISSEVYTLHNALKAGPLYLDDVPKSPGLKYSEIKRDILDKIPPNGNWRNLPIALQKAYMGSNYNQHGGHSGMARRMSWEEPSLTLTCRPMQKQTERCHPDESRPFTVREYARIQTFPDNWQFMGSLNQQYQQIGNAVPVNLAKEIGYSVIKFLNDYYDQK